MWFHTHDMFMSSMQPSFVFAMFGKNWTFLCFQDLQKSHIFSEKLWKSSLHSDKGLVCTVRVCVTYCKLLACLWFYPLQYLALRHKDGVCPRFSDSSRHTRTPKRRTGNCESLQKTSSLSYSTGKFFSSFTFVLWKQALMRAVLFFSCDRSHGLFSHTTEMIAILKYMECISSWFPCRLQESLKKEIQNCFEKISERISAQTGMVGLNLKKRKRRNERIK